MEKIAWGIVAPGNIARSFAEALKAEEDAVCYAVASRAEERAIAFALEFGFEKVCPSYGALIADPGVDVVYIASPHSSHKDLSIAALKAGKHVLCEKPSSLSASETAEVLSAARESGCFYMEALWMKFNPAVTTALRWLREGRIGTPLAVKSDFCIWRRPDPEHRLFNPSLGGGALLDVGIYPVTFAGIAAGASARFCERFSAGSHTGRDAGRQDTGEMPFLAPDSIQSAVRRGPTGVDHFNSIIFAWKSGFMGHLSDGIDIEGTRGFQDGYIAGTEGNLHLPSFWMSQKVELSDATGTIRDTADCPFDTNGYEYEIREVHRCLREGLRESPVHTHADTLAIMHTLDAVRSCWSPV